MGMAGRPAHDAGEPMNRAKLGIRQGDPAEYGGEGHVLAGRDVGPVAIRPRQRSCRPREPLAADVSTSTNRVGSSCCCSTSNCAMPGCCMLFREFTMQAALKASTLSGLTWI